MSISSLFHRNYVNSLKSRLIISSIFMVVILLPMVGITIFNAYNKHMSASVENELVAYSYSILAVAEVENGTLVMPEMLTENQFNISDSGLYALITSTDNRANVLWRSGSLLALPLPHNIKSPDVGKGAFYSLNIQSEQHFSYSFTVVFSDDSQSTELTIHIIKQQSDYIELMNEFQQQLWLGLALVMIVLILLQIVWLKWSLKPLATLKREIADIEHGSKNELKGHYPTELKQVTEQLNALLATEQNQRKRYRNALSDLAHSLKTPLAVLQGNVSEQQDDRKQQSQTQIDTMNLMIEHQLKRAQSAGQSSWHLGVSIAPMVNKLVNSLGKIYRDKHLSYQVEISDGLIFRGDEADLLELLGNLLDNASKAASNQIIVKAYNNENHQYFVVEDDGLGIDNNKADAILQRGTRADTYQQGHGIGLAIVRDLVESYQGKINISRSKQLGGAKFTLIFSRP